MKLFNIRNRKLYIICFIPRSGSSNLCYMLKCAGLGMPQEYYYPHEFKERCKEFKIINKTPIEYFNHVILSQPSSIAGIKTSWDALCVLREETKGLIDKLEPKYIYMTRNNKIKQAISWARAIQTDIWSCHDKDRNIIPKYSKEAIDECLKNINYQERRLEDYLKDKKTLHISYETISDDTITDISKFLNVEINTQFTSKNNSHSILRDKINEEWYNKYVKT